MYHLLLSSPQPCEEKVRLEISVQNKIISDCHYNNLTNNFTLSLSKETDLAHLSGNIKISLPSCFHILKPHLKLKID